MKKQPGRGTVIAFAAILMICSCVLMWYAVAGSALRYRIADTGISLETSHGREARQTAELAAVNEALPRTQAELTDLQPRAEAAAAEVTGLKQRRTELREANKTLEEDIQRLGGEVPPEVKFETSKSN